MKQLLPIVAALGLSACGATTSGVKYDTSTAYQQPKHELASHEEATAICSKYDATTPRVTDPEILEQARASVAHAFEPVGYKLFARSERDRCMSNIKHTWRPALWEDEPLGYLFEEVADEQPIWEGSVLRQRGGLLQSEWSVWVRGYSDGTTHVSW